MARFIFLLAMIAASPALGQGPADPPVADAAATEAGHALFGKMNCAGCHAYDLTGGMGPDLTDNSWQYGGTSDEIFHTIAEGTARGMPAWKDKLTADEIWQIVRYIQSRHQ